MKNKRYISKAFISSIFLSLLLLTGLNLVNADCDIWAYSAVNEPVANVTVTYRNITNNETLSTNTTGANGRSVRLGNCVNVSITTKYPSSGYTAVLTNASVRGSGYINDWITARVQLKNTLGYYLEGQDCSVSVYGANTSILIHDYDTLCSTGEPYIDASGNWVSPADCKFTDSRGWYYFKGEITEDLGFEYDKYYDLVFVCNSKTATVTFLTTLEKRPDMNKLEAFVQKQSGYIILGVVFAIIVLIAAACIIIVIYYTKKKDNKR